MKLFIVARRARIFALNAALIVVTTVLPMLLPAFAQQEVSPTLVRSMGAEQGCFAASCADANIQSQGQA
jgi:hypothetical protein